MVTGLDRGNALTYGLDDASTFVAEDDGESAFRVLTGERIGI